MQEAAIAERIKALGSPAVSELMSLPIQRGGVEAKFGLDLKPYFAKIAGADQPGTYLIGLRPADGGKRQWLRAQVTDLTLSAVEEAARVHFAVTSLQHGQAGGRGAGSGSEGVRDDKFITLAEGVTDADGASPGRLDKAADLKRRSDIKRGDRHQGRWTRWSSSPIARPSQYARENWSKPERARGSPGPSIPSATALRRRARCAMCSPSGRSTGPKKPCTSRASCAIISAAS